MVARLVSDQTMHLERDAPIGRVTLRRRAELEHVHRLAGVDGVEIAPYADEHHLEAIEHQIEAGKNAMPSYEGKLSESDIIDVAAYVEEQAERGWQR